VDRHTDSNLSLGVARGGLIDLRTKDSSTFRPDTTRVYLYATSFHKNVPNPVTLLQTYQKAGYFVARVGKLYHYGVPAPIDPNGLGDPPSLQKVINPRGWDKDDENQVIHFTGPKGQMGAARRSWVPVVST